ncbi:hypothetical protein EV368DRAFT_78317 [Lentinula lateritia]|uniref:Uncharacterized protein n=1 Tax=Lentinula aff. lateritia TaxID=2804960 RepID=A0ACC1U4K2_9AGAR|nr:hypothetical protein F5876DRAFT_75522 [Lentinula aff. lateritia]KAJ3856830.1 hypothetical protein EV368DRAFT_78317 [Lentinula lateritia]
MSVAGVPPDIAQLTGPVVIGFAAQWGLFGCSSVQLYLYYLNFPKDTVKLKTLVYGLYILDFAQTLLVTAFVFHMLGSGWGNVNILESVGLSWLALPFFNAISGTIVQCFYAWRIYTLSKSIPLAVVIVLLALCEGTSGLAFSIILETRVPTFADLQSQTFVVTTVCLMSSACCDILISLSMVYLLNRARKESAFGKTEQLVTRLIRLIVGGGILTASFAILDAVFLLAYQNNNYHLAPNSALAKLYTNALMVLLNSRAQFRSNNGNVVTYTFEGESGQKMSRATSGLASMPTLDRARIGNGQGIAVDVTVDSTTTYPDSYPMGRFDKRNTDEEFGLVKRGDEF